LFSRIGVVVTRVCVLCAGGPRAAQHRNRPAAVVPAAQAFLQAAARDLQRPKPQLRHR
jgi:transcriptional regulator of aromatic amino acid metabolism